MNQSDIVFLADRLDTFVALVKDPQGYFKRRPDALPESLDLKMIAAGLYLLGDCYLRGKGLKFHPASKTREEAMEALTEVMNGVNNEVKKRPYLYEDLCGVLARGQAAVEIDWLIDGYSKWSESKGGEHGD